MELTLQQQFNYRLYTDATKQMSEKDLLDNLKKSHTLLKQKSFILDNFLKEQTKELCFFDDSDPTYMFKQHLTYKEFEKYNKEQLVEVLLNTLKTLMFTENELKKTLSCV